MTVVAALAVMGLMGFFGPRIGLRLFGGPRGVLIGGLAALVLAPAAGFALAALFSGINGRPMNTEFEATMNAWGLALFVTGAICLHLIGRLRRERGRPLRDNRWREASDGGTGDSHGGADGGSAGESGGGDGD
ncbi:MAG: hypothetical protein VYD87_04740 [Pseudomonadota bacterium]|nr:hypothetical protein [Pseudomonadota bacterium]MEE3101721.1 hypothetical protein [Pseudomonadota bacterium]